MDELASYLAGRGLPLLIMGHYLWMARYLSSYFRSREGVPTISIKIGISLPINLEIGFRPGRRLPSSLVIFAIASVQALDRLSQLFRTLFGRLAASAAFSARDYVRANAPASAPLVAGIVIVFFSGDSWKILGQGFDWRFGALLGFFLVLSVLGAADARHLTSHLPATQADIDAGSGAPAANSLAAALADIGYELPAAPRIPLLGMFNVITVYLGIITTNLLLVGFLVAGALTLIGIIRIDASLTRQLSGGATHILLRLPGGMVITQELLSLSLTLGGLAILSFTFLTLTNRQARVDFAATATTGLRRVLIAFTVYRAAQANEVALTGVSSLRSRHGSQ